MGITNFHLISDKMCSENKLFYAFLISNYYFYEDLITDTILDFNYVEPCLDLLQH